MIERETYLKTQQAADALGISVSTLKRWVDAGEIGAARTVGKHRLISLVEALRFARERDLATDALQQLAGSGLHAIARVDEVTRGGLLSALKEGRALDARRLILAAHAVLGSGAALADELIGPVMKEVGHGWQEGTWDVYEEHQASQIVASALNELIARGTRGVDMPGPLALGASPEGDLYTLATLLCQLTLRELGWDVKNLGANLPLRSLSRAVETHRPRLVFLSISRIADPIDLVERHAEFHATTRAHGAEVVLGGRALSEENPPRLESSLVGRRMSDLANFGRRLIRASRPDGDGNPGAKDRPGCN
jgi:excisionase family DNA binding protein